ncbi:MAG TPA: alkaline phosphatase family protein [Candidatus Tumulicola sp.]|jgi:phospholipase C
MRLRNSFGFVLFFFIVACAGGTNGESPSGPLPLAKSNPARVRDTQPITHVVVVIQENRSFDNLFATYPGADGATTGLNYNGKTIRLKKRPLKSNLDLNNSHLAWDVDYDGGKMDGFGLVFVNGRRCVCAYQYVDPTQIAPYWTMAQQYVLADHMFQTQSSGSFTAHQDLIRGDTAINSSESLVDFPSRGPWGCDAPSGTKTTLLTSTGQYLVDKGPFPCLSYATLRDLLDAKSVSWKYYTPSVHVNGGDFWSAFDAIDAVRYGPEWSTNVSTPETKIFSDIKKGSLASVTWIVPDAANSDHPKFSRKDTGPSWVAQVVDAIGESPYWNNTAIFVTWDDWGGWYDHVAPPQLDYNGLGFRVPLLVVSPYAKAGYVSHTQYEFGSILKFIEDNWSLGNLGTTDVRANSLDDVFNFSQTPLPFNPIPAKYSKSYFQHQRPSNQPLDDN